MMPGAEPNTHTMARITGGLVTSASQDPRSAALAGAGGGGFSATVVLRVTRSQNGIQAVPRNAKRKPCLASR